AVRVETEPRTLLVTGRTVTFHAGDAGNPHAVVFVDDVDAAPVEEVGRGLQRAATFPDGGNVEFVEVRPDGSLRQRAFARGRRAVAFRAGDAGIPHAVVFVGDVDAAPVEEVGRGLQRAATFPDGVNVEFVEVRPDGSLRQRTFERGSGETLACGSGATVAAAAAVRTGRVAGPKVDVLLRGGTLTIDVGDDRVLMSGPAREVFRGEVEVDPTA